MCVGPAGLCNVIAIGIGNVCSSPLNSTTPVPPGPAVPSGSDSPGNYIMSTTYMAAVSGLINETGVMN